MENNKKEFINRQTLKESSSETTVGERIAFQKNS